MDLTHVLSALGSLVLEQTDDGRWARRGEIPDWCAVLGLEELMTDRPVVVQEVFPFLEIFLPDAERVWRTGSREHARSDFWTEIGTRGEEVHLEAFALCVEAHSVLVVTRDEQLFARRERVLQRARELRFAHGELTREVELKDILVHSIVHDLASPLHGIMGALTLLSDLSLSDEAAELVSLGLQAGKRQQSLVADILDVFSAEHGAIAAAPDASTTVDLARAIQEVVSLTQPAARVNQIEIHAPVEPGPLRVVAEETRLVRVLTNLLENALRHSPRGGRVVVSVQREEHMIELRVEDQGPGVPKEVLPYLFELFAGGQEGVAGTGLGLYFCRITVERWGGGIGYERRPQGGARFWIRLLEAGAPAPVEAGRPRHDIRP